MKNFYLIILSCFLTFFVTSCQKVEITPNVGESNVTPVSANKTSILLAPNDFIVSNISTNKNITFSWSKLEEDEGYVLKLYSNSGLLINTYEIAKDINQYTVNVGEGSFKAVLRRICDVNILSEASEIAVTVCCGGVVVPTDEVDNYIQNGQSTCLNGYSVQSYTLTQSQNLSTLALQTYIGVTDYVLMYGFTNSATGTPTNYNMIPMSNILTVNAANTGMKHTLQLDFQNYQYCKVFFIPWKLANCSVL